MTLQDFDSPSIYELYNSAKKLLSLQNRVENRNLRKENSKAQKNHIKFNEGDYLDLLSPLDYEDKNPKKLPISLMDITPVSMNDYSPPNNISYKKKELSPVENSDISASFKNFKSSPGNKLKKTIKPKSNLTSSFQSPQYQSPAATTPTTPSSSRAFTPQSLPSNGINHMNMNMSMSMTNNVNMNSSKKIVECYNCHTVKTPLWRKDPDGNTLCNACGLFLKLHGTTRPLSLKTDVIKKRSSRRSINGKLSNSVPSSNDLSKMRFGSNHSTPNSNFDLDDNELINGGPRYKNVLILPKPSSTTTTTNINITGDNKSLPIPRTSTSIPNSPSSPMINEYNQSFKRKKSNLSRKPSVSSMSSFQYSNSRKNSSISIPTLNQRNSFNTPTASSSFRTMSFFDKPRDLGFRQFDSQPSPSIHSPSIQSVTTQSPEPFQSQSFDTKSQSSYPKPEFFNQETPSQDLDWLKFEI
ncbi:hypothetical protein CLIB1444_25S00254 [[Candida] jaroonii]|uniref:Uncharacterized protein n=1 Tax=[Candida] jaroonii TaxID=467808 RepID=A0ACA9YFV9_9ASCO|nr:hypothetical protein CLIB1444_25S00254 [[Candida] jaroonii]